MSMTYSPSVVSNRSLAPMINGTDLSAMFHNGTGLSGPIYNDTAADYSEWHYVYFYGMAVILPVGLLCNSLSFAVFLSSRSLRRTTTGHYLSALAVADTIFLLGELLRWLNSMDSYGPILGIDFMDTILFWCRTTYFLRYAGKLASAWITVVISVERYITVAYPLRVARISTTKIAKVVIGIIYVLCSAFGAYPYWTISINYSTKRNATYCGQKNKTVYEGWTMGVVRTGSLFLPSAFIFVFTFLVICYLRRAQKKKRELEVRKKLNGKGVKKSIDFQLTVMLISVAIAFLVLRLPYTITFYLFNNRKKYMGDNPNPWFLYRLIGANKIADLFYIANYASNFFLYCLCGSSFRTHLKRLLKMKRVRRSITWTSRTFSSRMHVSQQRPSPPRISRTSTNISGNMSTHISNHIQEKNPESFL